MELYMLTVLFIIIIITYYTCLNFYENTYEYLKINTTNVNEEEEEEDEEEDEEEEEEEEDEEDEEEEEDEEDEEEKPDDFYAPIILNKVPMFKAEGEWNDYI